MAFANLTASDATFGSPEWIQNYTTISPEEEEVIVPITEDPSESR